MIIQNFVLGILRYLHNETVWIFKVSCVQAKCCSSILKFCLLV